MKCVICGMPFKRHEMNNTNECDDCLDVILPEIDAETEIDVNRLINPYGRAAAKIYDEDRADRTAQDKDE